MRREGGFPSQIVTNTCESLALNGVLGAKLRENVFILNDIRGKLREDTERVDMDAHDVHHQSVGYTPPALHINLLRDTADFCRCFLHGRHTLQNNSFYTIGQRAATAVEGGPVCTPPPFSLLVSHIQEVTWPMRYAFGLLNHSENIGSPASRVHMVHVSGGVRGDDATLQRLNNSRELQRMCVMVLGLLYGSHRMNGDEVGVELLGDVASSVGSAIRTTTAGPFRPSLNFTWQTTEVPLSSQSVRGSIATWATESCWGCRSYASKVAPTNPATLYGPAQSSAAVAEGARACSGPGAWMGEPWVSHGWALAARSRRRRRAHPRSWQA